MAAVAERVSPEEYLRLESEAERKAEYRDGEIVEVPGANRYHSRLQTALAAVCHGAIRHGPCEFHGSDLKVRAGSRNYLYPDGTISCDPQYANDRGDILLNPLVVFEILSPSTEGDDRRGKFLAYQEIESLREYVLLSSEEAVVEHFQRREDGWLLRFVAAGETLRLASVGVEIAVDDLYARVFA